MEENTTTWKSHSFTLMIFGGIVVLCSIFFVLGMLVGRNQGQRIAEVAFAEKEARKPAAESGGDDFKLNFYSETTEEKPDLKLQPTHEPAVTAAPAASPSAKAPTPEPPPAAKLDASDKAKSGPEIKPASRPESPARAESSRPATAKPAVARTPPPAPAKKEVFLQVMATRNKKQADTELTKVQSKGFKARILTVTTKNVEWHRVLVGPYKESEVGLAKSDLKAKGYKEPIVR